MASESKGNAEQLSKTVFYATVLGALLYAAVVFIFIVHPNAAHAPAGGRAEPVRSERGSHD